jgi:hypothetical protein
MVQPPSNLGAKGVVVDDRYLYMYGGAAGSTVRNDYWVLDIELNVWRQLSSAGTVSLYRQYMAVVPATKDVFIFGGFKSINSGNSNVAFRFNRAAKPIGVVLSTSAMTATVQTAGIVTNPDWAYLTPGLPVYVEMSGRLTQVPSQTSSYAVGTAITPTSILLSQW